MHERERERDYKGVRIEVRVCRIFCHYWIWCAVPCLVLPGLAWPELCCALFPSHNSLCDECDDDDDDDDVYVYVCVHTYDHITELKTMTISKA